MKCLKLKEYIEILQQYDENLYCILEEFGPSHEHPVLKENIHIMQSPYFPDFDLEIDEYEKVLVVGGL